MDVAELIKQSQSDLLSLAVELGLNEADLTRLSKEELLIAVLSEAARKEGYPLAGGILDIAGDGYGFLRQNGVRTVEGDVYVSQSQIRRFSLRTGDMLMGQVRPPKDSERFYGLVRVETVNGVDPESNKVRRQFDRLTPVFPDKLLVTETDKENLTTRLIDLLSPIGRGQRGLIVAPPKAGKTTLLKQIANGITENYDDVHLMVALIGERPEEVTDIKRSIKGEVYSSTFDEPVEDHCRVAELALERARRLVEVGKDVVILLDSITRLTRAYNLAVPTSGRTLSGGVDPVALYPPKQFFGAARNTEEGGSLTILAACLVDTGSRMDEVVYEEFKGTGNMELHLDRKLSEKRVFPAIDIQRSGTRREDLLLDEETLKQVWLLRRMVSLVRGDAMNPADTTEKVLERLRKTKDNVEFLATLSRTTPVAD
jgi:transcription termination factor Rho